eukprot:CCRYP_013598-RA/>CCRYP_013598-RA protein AED:0.69 eAED:0.21 QI:0/0/0/1/1/1/2/0/289
MANAQKKPPLLLGALSMRFRPRANMYKEKSLSTIRGRKPLQLNPLNSHEPRYLTNETPHKTTQSLTLLHSSSHYSHNSICYYHLAITNNPSVLHIHHDVAPTSPISLQLLAILASSRANAAQISAPGIDSSVAFCGPSCLKQTSRLANSNCAGAALLHRTAFAAAGVSKTRYLTSRNMNSFFGDGESVPRINREAMAEIIEDVANSSREECGYVIIDVRGHDEVAYTEGALTMDEEDFSEQFGFEKPRLTKLLFSRVKLGLEVQVQLSWLKWLGIQTSWITQGSNEWFS